MQNDNSDTIVRAGYVPQKVAALASSEDKPRDLEWKREESESRDPACKTGSRVRRAAACFICNPKPLVKALQKAFHTIPSMTHCNPHHRKCVH